MAATLVQRARTVMGWIKDDTETLIDPTIGLKYMDALITVHGPILDQNGDPVVSPTNDQLAQFYLDWQRQQHKAVLINANVPVAVEGARTTERATQEAAVEADLGTEGS